MTTAIIAPRMPDWFALKLQPPETCAANIQDILKHLEGIERVTYAIRGEALRLFDDRELYRLFEDPAHRAPCTCTFRWLEVYLPDSARYCQEALVSRQRLCNAIPLEQATRIPRANLRLLEGVSASVQRMSEVQKQAEIQTEKQFAETLSRDHGQHLESSQRFTVKLSASDYAAVMEALDKVGKLMGIEDRAGELVALCVDFVLEWQQ